MEKEQTKNQQEKNQQEKNQQENQKKSQKLQWHPAFCSALRLELLEDAENLEFTDEFQLTEKPLQIDCTVVKVKRDCKIKNEIGKIFRKHNIFEYKSPKDELNIDTFYKAVAYACLYKVLPNHVDEIQAEEITITLIRDRKPVKLLQKLSSDGYECRKENKTGGNGFPGTRYFCAVKEKRKAEPFRLKENRSHYAIRQQFTRNVTEYRS